MIISKIFLFNRFNLNSRKPEVSEKLPKVYKIINYKLDVVRRS